MTKPENRAAVSLRNALWEIAAWYYDNKPRGLAWYERWTVFFFAGKPGVLTHHKTAR